MNIFICVFNALIYNILISIMYFNLFALICSNDLEGAKRSFGIYTQKCHDNKEKLQANENELAVLQVKEENTKTAEALQSTKVY